MPLSLIVLAVCIVATLLGAPEELKSDSSSPCCLCIYDDTSPDSVKCETERPALFGCPSLDCVAFDGKCYPSFFSDCKAWLKNRGRSCAETPPLRRSTLELAKKKKDVNLLKLQKGCKEIEMRYDGHGTSVDECFDQVTVCMEATEAKRCGFLTAGCSTFSDPKGARRILAQLSKCLRPDQCVKITGSKKETVSLVGPFSGTLSLLSVQCSMDPVTFSIKKGQCEIEKKAKPTGTGRTKEPKARETLQDH